MAQNKYFSKILFLLIGLAFGFQIGKWVVNSTISNTEKVDQVLNLTEKYYIHKIDPDTLSESAIEGILSDLDPHSVYIPANIQETIMEEFEGSFEGIGVEFQIINDTITIVSPIVGGPSEKLGIQAGDKIVAIEDSSAIGLNNNQIIKKLRGEKGSEVSVAIFRPSVDEIFDYTITRDVIPINSVETALLMQDSVGYVNVTRFAEKTTNELQSALTDLSQQGMKYLILDLRNNPGGLLEKAVSISDMFIDDEKLIVYTDGRIPEFDEEFKASKKSEYENIPLIILINRGSASASEIVSGAVQDWDRGIIIGERSFGKGLVQRPFLLSDNSAIRLTISEYFTPSGRPIQRDFSNRKKYFSEVMNRDNDTLTVDHDSTDLKVHPEFKTAHGRKVYGKGGIEPDYIVTNNDLTSFTASLRSKNLFYVFIRSELDYGKFNLPDTLKSSLSSFLKYNVITDSKLNEFKSFLKTKEIQINEKEFETDKSYIQALLKAYIAREFFNSIGWYSVLLSQDEPFQKALHHLSDSRKILNEYYSK